MLNVNKLKAKVQFENECNYIEATFSEFYESIHKNPNLEEKNAKKIKIENALKDFDPGTHWAYADYKYMIELINKDQNSFNENVYLYFCFLLKNDLVYFYLKCIDWKAFGFKERNAKDSTLWISTNGAYTPCHYDTYGYNLVAQIYGM